MYQSEKCARSQVREVGVMEMVCAAWMDGTERDRYAWVFGGERRERKNTRTRE